MIFNRYKYGSQYRLALLPVTKYGWLEELMTAPLEASSGLSYLVVKWRRQLVAYLFSVTIIVEDGSTEASAEVEWWPGIM